MERIEYNKKELKIGTRVEIEHTKSKKVRDGAVKDYLKWPIRYYTMGLFPMERRLKKGKFN